MLLQALSACGVKLGAEPCDEHGEEAIGLLHGIFSIMPLHPTSMSLCFAMSAEVSHAGWHLHLHGPIWIPVPCVMAQCQEVNERSLHVTLPSHVDCLLSA